MNKILYDKYKVTYILELSAFSSIVIVSANYKIKLKCM